MGQGVDGQCTACCCTRQGQPHQTPQPSCRTATCSTALWLGPSGWAGLGVCVCRLISDLHGCWSTACSADSILSRRQVGVKADCRSCAQVQHSGTRHDCTEQAQVNAPHERGLAY
jgi:hypothetical protein